MTASDRMMAPAGVMVVPEKKTSHHHEAYF
jgi:hypothetical protein